MLVFVKTRYIALDGLSVMIGSRRVDAETRLQQQQRLRRTRQHITKSNQYTQTTPGVIICMKLQGKLFEGHPEKNDFTDELLNDTAGKTALVLPHIL